MLEDKDFNKDYFTQIDIRKDKEIKLYAKEAKLLTTHPEGSYELTSDEKGELTLMIVEPNKFSNFYGGTIFTIFSIQSLSSGPPVRRTCFPLSASS